MAHDSTRSPSMEIPAPALFRGSILTHLPLLVFPLDSTGGSVAWVPIPEMGVIITPSFKTENYQFEFPISFLAFTPFLDYYGTLNDFSVEAIWRVSRDLSFSGQYRLILGRFRPLQGRFVSHIAALDVGIPVRTFYLSGVRFEWSIKTAIEFASGYLDNDQLTREYQGNILLITPYWKFPVKYGQVVLSFRTVISSKINRLTYSSNEVERARSENFSALEIKFVYP